MEQRKKWGMIGISRGAGSSFLTAVTAGFLAARKQNPAVLELGKGTLYDSLGLQRHFLHRPYESPYDVVREDGNVKQVANMYKGINWAVQTEENRNRAFDFREDMRLIYHVRGDILLCDFSGRTAIGEQAEDTWHLLREMDRVFVIVDPLPSKLLEGSATLARLRLSQLPITYVVNKDNPGVDSRELKGFLRLPRCVYIPCLSHQLIYSAEYGCKDPYSIKEIADQLTPCLDKMTDGIASDHPL